ncbi:MAG: Ig-like domain-containing protein [Cytophagales bacterium]|nr:Ig-like domain-containing protein [Cytophagales bacterium]
MAASATAAMAGTYTLTVTNAAGCTDQASTTVTLIDLPTAPTSAASDRDNFCADDNGTIDLTASGGNGTTVNWYTGGCGSTLTGSGNPLTIPSPTATTTYYARWENSCGASACVSVTVTVKPLPDPPTTSENAQEFCSGDDPRFANIDVNESGIQWYDAASGGNSFALADPLSTNSYYAAQIVDGCESNSRLQVDVTVTTTPGTPTTSNPNQNFCSCDNPTFADIDVNEINVQWYSLPSGGTPYNPADPLTAGTYYASQISGSCESSARLQVNVTVNNPPTSNNNSEVSTDEDVTYTFSTSDFPFSDTDGGTLSAIRVMTLPSEGALRLNSSPISAPTDITAASITAGQFQFVPDPNENDDPYTSFLFKVNDGLNNSVDDYTLTIVVNKVNDKPSFDLQASHTSGENDGMQTVTGFASSIDDGDPEETQNLTFHVASTPTSVTGILEFETYPAINSSGTLTYEAKANTNGSAEIEVYISDDGQPVGQTSSTKSFTINVTGVNGTPSFTLNGNPPAVNEDDGSATESAFALNIDDGDAELTQSLTFNISYGGSLQFATDPAIDATTGDLTYTPQSNSNGTATCSVTLTDGDKTSAAQNFTITVNPVNDPPTGGDRGKTINEDAILAFVPGDFTFSDIDGHLFAGIQIVSVETDGELKYNGTDVTIGFECPNVSLLTFTPTPDENNDDQAPYATFKFKVKDSSGDVSVDGPGDYTYTINVTPVNDRPTSNDDGSVSPDENTVYTFKDADFPFNDVDGHTFDGIRIRSNVSRGTLLYNGNPISINLVVDDVTLLTFTPVTNENGSPYTTFDFQVRDSQGSFSISDYKMSISVGAVNDRPTGDDETVTTLEDQPYSFSVADFTFNDVDGHTFDGIQITEIETAGDLEYNGTDVVPFMNCPDVSLLVFKPVSNENGDSYATFKFKVKDNSASENISNDTYTMTINVTAVNDPPSFTINGNPPAINEDAGAQTVNNFASAINDGDPGAGEVQTLDFILSIKSTTGNISFTANPDISESSGNLTYAVANNTYGTATISAVLQDNGGGDDTSAESQFIITVNNVNDPPTLTEIPDPAAINEDAGTQSVGLSGITAGINESQTLTVTATSSNTALVPNPTVVYTSPGTTGQLNYAPDLNMNGSSTITVTVDDGGSSSNTITRTFDVVVNPVNDPPTIDPISDPAPIPENAGEQNIAISGISPGGGSDEEFPAQSVSISASSSNPALIPDPVVQYENNSTGQIKYAPLLDQNGTATITVTLNDGQTTNNETVVSFVVSVSSVNNPPTIDDIPDPAAIDEDAGIQNIALSGITAGGGESQTLSVTASSDNQDLIPDGNISVNYTSPSTTGSLSYHSVENRFGSAVITVTVDDGGDTNNSVEEQFVIAVNPVADTPTATDATANGDNQTTEGLVITPNVNDGDEVSHFKITNIMNGNLYKNDGVMEITDGQFILSSEGIAGLKFTPANGSTTEGSFSIQAATGGDDASLGGAVITATIFRNSFPVSNGFSPIDVDEDSNITSVDLFAIFDDADHPDFELNFSILVNTNPNLFDSLVISDNLLDIYLALNQFGDAEITIEAMDPNGASVTDVLSISIAPVNDPPVLETPPIGLGNQDLAYEYLIVFSDPENQPITIDALSIPNWLTYEEITTDSARVFGTPTDEQVGVVHQVEFFAFDTENDTTHVAYTINVQNENDPPTITSQADTVMEVGDFYDYLVTADDPDLDIGDVLSFTIELQDGSDIFLNYQDNGNGTATIFGTPPSGTIGLYDIRVVVRDLALDSAVQVYKLRVKKENNLPQVSSFPISTDEDVPFYFSPELFKAHFFDTDGDTLQNVKITDLPLYGRLSLFGALVKAGDIIEYVEIDSLKYIPEENNDDNDFFGWNGFDGTDYALVPRSVNVNVRSVIDPPEILDFDWDPILFEFANTEGTQITDGTVFDGDGDKIEMAVISFKENYLKGEDLFFYDTLSLTDLTYIWEDSAGVLTIKGIENTNVYTNAITFLRYMNTNSLNPNISPRTIEILLYDADTVSIPYLRQVEFENTFVDLIIPTGITPNNDNVNDTWKIEHIERYEDTKVSVFSKSGELLYESIGYDEEWDGTSDGEVLPPGPYYYVISINKFKRNYKGTISILR